MRTWYDPTCRSMNASLFKFVFTFAGDLVHFLVAVGRGWSPSGLTGVTTMSEKNLIIVFKIRKPDSNVYQTFAENSGIGYHV